MATMTKNAHNDTDTNARTGPARKLLSFCMGQEEYAMDILAVREIIGLIDITPLPRTPEFVKGVINLRGKIIPVIELRSRFGLPSVDYTEQTCIIVVDVRAEGDTESRQMGVIVDSVREVLDIPRSAIEPPPAFGYRIPMDFITGIGKVKDKVVVILETARVLSSEESSLLATAANAAEDVAEQDGPVRNVA